MNGRRTSPQDARAPGASRVLVPTLLLFVVAGAVAVTLSGEWWLRPQAGGWSGIDALLLTTTVVVGIAFVIVMALIAYALFRWSAREGSRASHDHENPRLEWTLIGITSLGIVALLAPGLFVYGRTITPPPEATTIEVVGEQWNWNYRYSGADGQLGAPRDDLFGRANPMGVDPEDPAALDDRWIRGGSLVVPVDEPVRLRLRSRDVIHIYFVPEFRVKMAAMPGTVNELWFTPERVGEFDAVCTEFCGVAHHGMVGRVRVVERDEYEAWLAEQPTVGEVLGLVETTEADE